MRLSPWPLVAAVYNLEVAEGLRPPPFITAHEARLMYRRAIRKLVRALAKRGVDETVVMAYLRLRDEGDARQHANLAALLPAPVRTRDEADPSPARSLRQVR